MLVLGTLILIALLCFFVFKNDGAFMIGMLTAAILAFAVFLIPVYRMDTQAKIAEFNAIKASRIGGSPIEAAAWRMKVAETNAWLANTQYYNRSLFDLWFPDDVERLEPIP